MKLKELYKGDKLTEWLIDLIEREYKDDIALVIHCNSLIAPGYENSKFPEFFVPLTERGKELACSFIIDRKKHDFYYRTWDYLQGFETLEDYDTMIFADSTLIYAHSQIEVDRYNDCKKRLFQNVNDTAYMKQIAIKDFNWAVDVYKDCCLKTDLCDVMKLGSYVCDLLTHSLAGINNRYIPQSFTNQFQFIESCTKKPDEFTTLWLKINRSRDAAEIKYYGAYMIDCMRAYLQLTEERPTTVNANSLAEWYEEMIADFNRVRGFAERKEPLNVRGWATKLQRSLDIATEQHGLPKYALLPKFNEDNLSEFLGYLDVCEDEIKQLLRENHAQLNQFNSVEDFINAYEQGTLRH